MNFKEIKAHWELTCNLEPEKAIEILLLSAILYESNEIEGEAACSLILETKKLEKNKNSPSKYFIKDNEKKFLEIHKQNPKILRSYMRNTEKITLFLRKKEVARSRAKVLIKSELKSGPTSILLIKEHRYWKIINLNAFFSD